jgi:hypothetical protein
LHRTRYRGRLDASGYDARANARPLHALSIRVMSNQAGEKVGKNQRERERRGGGEIVCVPREFEGVAIRAVRVHIGFDTRGYRAPG